MKVIRELGIYTRTEGSFIRSIEINLSPDTLIELFSIDLKKDPHVYMIYEVSYDQYVKLSILVPQISLFNFDEYSIYYECFQGPDWLK